MFKSLLTHWRTVLGLLFTNAVIWATVTCFVLPRLQGDV